MGPIVVCPANISEGRRLDTVRAIVDAIGQAPGVALLGWERDIDHNRAVVTFAGSPSAVSAGAFAGIQAAAALIDMERHSGQHPRIGGADVIPFVPWRGLSMPDCVALARSLGERVGESLRLPVFLYAEAAMQPRNRALADIRRGGYERLKRTLIQGVEPRPDFGPAILGKAGGCIIGARGPLIACNVFLDTADIAIAKAIARKIRESSGGLPGVQALGFLVRGAAQVSMNLTNYRVTSIADVVHAIGHEAALVGASISHAEIIGLLPEDALTPAQAEEFKVENYGPDHILEAQLAALL